MDWKLKILITGIALRLLLAPFTGHPWDLSVWQDVGYRTIILHENIYSQGLSESWGWGYYAYPPGWLIWCSISYFTIQNPHLHALIIKIPLIFADMLIAILVFEILRDLNVDLKKALIAMAVYFFNPVVLLTSSIWGMFDIIPVLFTLLSIVTFVKRRIQISGFFLGLGILFKIYPLLLLPLFTILIVKYYKRPIFTTLRFHLISLGLPFLFSLPFILDDYINFFSALTIHVSPSGWLTYWFPLSHISTLFKKYCGYIFFIILPLAYLYFYKRARHLLHVNIRLLNRALIALILLFYIISPKVNPQYLLWILPSAVIDVTLTQNIETKKAIWYLCGLNIILIMSLMPLNDYFILNFVSQFPNALSSYFMLGIGMVSSISFPIVSFYYFKNLTSKKHFSLTSIVKKIYPLLIVLLVFSIIMLPIPSNVKLNDEVVKVAFPESPATGFTILKNDYGVSDFLEKYECSIIVLALSPDFVNMYSGINKSQKLNSFFRISHFEEWSHYDFKRLIANLHEKGVEVILGVYLQEDYLVDNRGFTSKWLKERHPEVIEGGNIRFNSRLNSDKKYGIMEGETYLELFSRNVVSVVNDFKFDGVLLTYNKFQNQNDPNLIEDIEIALPKLSSIIREDLQKKLLITAIFQEGRIEFYKHMIEYVDFFIIQALPWSMHIYHLNGDIHLNNVKYLNEFIDNLQVNSSKLLITLEIMDEHEGWIIPKIFFELELKDFSRLKIGGFVYTFANLRSPYWVR